MSAKVLFWDIETAPIIAYVWGTYDQNVAINQIHTDWHVLAWSAKWKDDKKVMYMDQRNAKDITNDKKILEGLWKLLDEADVVVTQNGKKFDAKKVNARFIEHGMKPPSPYKHVDTLQLAKKQFGFTSNKLAYLSEKLCPNNKKSEHGKFPGFALWQECLKGNKAAWREMEKYNKQDVLALEELYGKLAPWGAGFNPNLYTESFDRVCSCGGSNWRAKGYYYTTTGKFRIYVCEACGSATPDKSYNLFPPEKIESLKQIALEKLKKKQKALYERIPKENRVCPHCGGSGCKIGGASYLNSKGFSTELKCQDCRSTFRRVTEPLKPKDVQEIRSMELAIRDCISCGSKDSLVRSGDIKKITKKGTGYRIRVKCKSCGRRPIVDLIRGRGKL